MAQVTTTQIRKVRKYSTLARRICSLSLAVVAASLLLVVKAVLSAPNGSGVSLAIGDRVFPVSAIDTPQLKIWILVVFSFGAVFCGVLLYLLRRIFANLARGEIFNAVNVGHIRQIGLWMLGLGFLNVVVPPINAVLLAKGFLGASTSHSFTFSLFDVLGPFAVAGVVYLVSWIMQVGLGVREEADELRREADLVV